MQKEWKPQTGDFIHDDRLPIDSSITIYHDELADEMIEDFGMRYDNEFIFCLFRQDQLQEMLDYRNSVELMHVFYKWFCSLEAVPYSWEPLWFMFVMHEKHGKRWSEDKQDWIDA